MPDILIRCPVFGTPIPTGLSTETIVLDSLDDLSIPLRCPACMKVHKWQRKDAWISDEINGTPQAHERGGRWRSGGIEVEAKRKLISASLQSCKETTTDAALWRSTRSFTLERGFDWQGRSCRMRGFRRQRNELTQRAMECEKRAEREKDQTQKDVIRSLAEYYRRLAEQYDPYQENPAQRQD